MSKQSNGQQGDAHDFGQRTALIVNPAINHFFDLEGYRLAEALRTLGIAVTVATLEDAPHMGFDWCFVNNPFEAAQSTGCAGRGRQLLAELAERCEAVFGISMEDMNGPWFQPVYDMAVTTKLDALLDLGLRPQPSASNGQWKIPIRFVLNGMTKSEKQRAKLGISERNERPIPWAMIGIQTPRRVRIAELLVRNLAPHGFVYLPVQNAEDAERRDLNEAMLMRVLSNSAYYIWCSQYGSRYMESQRYRQAVLAGAAPVKVVDDANPIDDETPFSFTLLHENSLTELVVLPPPATLHGRAAQEFCRMPGLEASLAELLDVPLPPEELENGE
ncbi:MAG: hypothetical protein H6640_12415 [Caldilineaceae bacterium]|nr:hypothetical protein [Caldilineaceae bacterium]